MPLPAALLLLFAGVVAADPPAKPEKASMVYYTGKVQGVGFRPRPWKSPRTTR